MYIHTCARVHQSSRAGGITLAQVPVRPNKNNPCYLKPQERARQRIEKTRAHIHANEYHSRIMLKLVCYISACSAGLLATLVWRCL